MKHAYCAGCGLRAPTKTSACPACGANEALMVTTDAETLVAAAEVWFACVSCLLRSPLDAIEPDARAHCYRCGERQALPRAYFRDALHVVHDVAGALAREDATTWMTERFFGDEDEHLVRVGLAAPRCPTCGTFDVRWEGRKGALSITCGECGTATYDAAAAWSVYKGTAAVVTPTHRTDVRHAPARRDRRAKARVCPTCAAPLVRGVGESFAKCAFCATTSRVRPPRSLASDPPTIRMTMFFVGEPEP